ncbi:hypothetical protein ACFVHI_30000 [Kitasatospora sp. NPDC127121]|uniref:hypothetical protein n=1 Tax=Kitasatospora sp. NPDC127121 TaxID=3345371 RepID=UPI00363AD592
MDADPMNRSELVANLQKYPSMFGLDGSYSMYVAFFRGYEIGADAEWLRGFRDWLVRDLGYGQNLGWESLIIRAAMPGRSDHWQLFGPRDEETEQALTETLFRRLEEFDLMFP